VQTHYFAMPFAGTVESWYLVVNNALTTAPNTWEVQIDGVQVTGTPITIAISGAAGDNATQAATAANSFAAGANVMVVGTTIGNADASVDTRFIITVRRS
jgi:3-deoxy-D-arabino-heptulosonate 7-phosphate (DAHP) synthase